MDAIIHTDTPGQTLYVRFDDDDDTAVDLTAGTGIKATRYAVDEEELGPDGAALPAGDYHPTVHVGTAAAQSVDDVQVGQVPGEFKWDGTAVVDQLAAIHARLPAGGQSMVGPSDVTGAPDTRDLEPVTHVWQLKRTADGSLRSTNPFYVRPGDANLRVGWNCDIPQVLPPGTVIRTQSTPVLTESSDDITITHIGHGEKVAKVELDIAADAVATDDPDTEFDIEGHWVMTTIINSNGGGPVAVYGLVVVQEAP